jgi:DNA-binding MarR family transcriptional regulator
MELASIMAKTLAKAATVKPVYRLEDQVGFMLRQANQRHLTIFQRHITDLTPTQFATLAKLSEMGPSSQIALGQATAMDAATLAGVIDRLVSRGLVDRAADPTDKRRRVIRLTGAGSSAFADSESDAHLITSETLVPLSKSEREQFLFLLAKIAGRDV